MDALPPYRALALPHEVFPQQHEVPPQSHKSLYQPYKSLPQLHKVQTPELKVRWFAGSVASEGHSHKGKVVNRLLVELQAGITDDPICVPGCPGCLLFRRRRQWGRDECICGLKQIKGYILDPWSMCIPKFKRFDQDIDDYRRGIDEQLRANEDFFRDRFLEVLGKHPDLRHDDFIIRVSVDIKRYEGVNVKSVEIKPLDKKLREDNPWKRPVDSRNKEIKKENPSYAGAGIIVIDFELHYLHGQVRFGAQMELPLKKAQLPLKEEEEEGELWDRRSIQQPPRDAVRTNLQLEWGWAYKLATRLSDKSPKGQVINYSVMSLRYSDRPLVELACQFSYK